MLAMIGKCWLLCHYLVSFLLPVPAIFYFKVLTLPSAYSLFGMSSPLVYTDAWVNTSLMYNMLDSVDLKLLPFSLNTSVPWIVFNYLYDVFHPLLPHMGSCPKYETMCISFPCVFRMDKNIWNTFMLNIWRIHIFHNEKYTYISLIYSRVDLILLSFEFEVDGKEKGTYVLWLRPSK